MQWVQHVHRLIAGVVVGFPEFDNGLHEDAADQVGTTHLREHVLAVRLCSLRYKE